jgi:hypothetical protein
VDGKFFAAGTLSGSAGKYAGVHELAEVPDGSRRLKIVNRWYRGHSIWYTGLAIVPDPTHGYTIWTSATEGELNRLTPDLKQFPVAEGGVMWDPGYLSALHYDPLTHTVLAGRNIIGDIGAFEIDAATREIKRTFRLPKVAIVESSGITRGPNGTVVSITSSATGQRPLIRQWTADGTFLRSIELWVEQWGNGVTGDLDTGGILWAGTFQGNHPPEVECLAPQAITCSPRGSDVELTVTVSDHDHEQKLSIIIRVADQELVADNLPATSKGISVPFYFSLPVGDHEIEIEVNDGLESSFCHSTIAVQRTGAPIPVSVPADITVEYPQPASFSEAPTFTHPCNRKFTVTHTDENLPVSGKEVKKVRRTWTATEAAGLSTSVSQTITWIDYTPPRVEGVQDIRIITTDASGAVVNYPPFQVVDDLEVSFYYSPASGSRFPIGTSTASLIVYDRGRNSAKVDFNVTVVTAASVLDSMLKTVNNSFSLDRYLKENLLMNLIHAKAHLASNQPKAAIAALQAFDKFLGPSKYAFSAKDAATLSADSRALQDALSKI